MPYCFSCLKSHCFVYRRSGSFARNPYCYTCGNLRTWHLNRRCGRSRTSSNQVCGHRNYFRSRTYHQRSGLSHRTCTCGH